MTVGGLQLSGRAWSRNFSGGGGSSVCEYQCCCQRTPIPSKKPWICVNLLALAGDSGPLHLGGSGPDNAFQ